MQKGLKEMRQSVGINQGQLADCLGVTQSAVSQWEAGMTYPRPPLLTPIAKLYNCTEGDVIAAVTEARKARLERDPPPTEAV